MKIFKRILKILGLTVLGFCIFVTVWNTVDKATGYTAPLFGHRMSVVVTSSMETVAEGRTLPEDTYRIKKNEVIITETVNKYEDIKIYDVLTYYNGSILVCHRVVDLYVSNDVQYVVLQGDANNTPDVPIEYCLVKGRVTTVLPSGLGTFLLFIQSGYGLMAICFSIASIFLGVFIYENAKKDKKPKSVSESTNSEVTTENKPKEKPIEKKMVKLICPKCGETFEVCEDEKIVICPKCKAKLKRGKNE